MVRCRRSAASENWTLILSTSEKISRIRVLLAEDDLVNQEVAKRMLEKSGVEVIVASDGAEAVKLYETERFDAVLLDLEMPVMDGWEAAAEIRRLEMKSETRIPLLALTAHSDKGQLRSCLEAGMDGYVTKPISKEQLLRKLEEVRLRK